MLSRNYKNDINLNEQFGQLSGIKADPLKAFLGFIIVVRFFGINRLRNNPLHSGDDIAYLRELINNERNVISDVLQDLAFDQVLDNLSIPSLDEVYSYVNEFINSQKIIEELIVSTPFYEWLNQSLKEDEFIELWNNREELQRVLGIFPIDRTEASLIVLDDSRRVFNENLIHFYLCTNVSKIYVISYDNHMSNKEDYHRIISKAGVHNALLDRLVFIDEPLLNFNYLEATIDHLEENSFLLLIGVENLLSSNNITATGTATFQNGALNLHTPYTVNWNEFVDGLDRLFGKAEMKKMRTTMIYMLDDLFNPVDFITEAAHSMDSFDITVIAHDQNPIITEILEAIEAFGNNEIDDEAFNSIVNQNRERMGDELYQFLLGIKCLMKNDYLAAEEHFSVVLNHMHPANKILVANIYINKKQYEKAFHLLAEVYVTDRYTLNLMPTILEAVSQLEEEHLVEEWLSKALEINNEDLRVIQYAANYYTHNKEYKESAEKWDQLYRLTHAMEYKLLYEINMILDQITQHDEAKIIQKLMYYADTYPELKSEVLFKLGLILYKNKKNPAKGLHYFLQIDSHIQTPNAYNAAIHRINIYKDKLSDVDPIRTNEAEIAKRQKDFIIELIRDVGILTFRDQGNSSWSNEIEDSFPYDEWRKHLLEITLMKIEQWSRVDAALFNETQIDLAIDESSYTNILSINGQDYVNPEDFGKQLLLLFYSAFEYVTQGEFQSANDTIFTIFRLANTANKQSDRNLAVIFGLIAWSNSNYKMGEEVESIVAAISAIELAIQCEEVMFAFHYGFKPVIDFLYNHSKDLNMDNNQQQALYTLVQQLEDDIIERKYYFILGQYDYLINEKPKHLVQLSSLWEQHSEVEVIINVAEDEEETFVNGLKILVDAYYSNGMVQQACEYIIRLKKTVHWSLIEKASVSYKLYHEWAIILVRQGEYNHALEFILSSMAQINKLRTVNYKRERSFLGKQANFIYRTYLEVLGRQSIAHNKDRLFLNNPIVQDVMVNIAPRSIIEQKLFNRDESLNNEILNHQLIEAANKYYDLFHIISKMQQKGIDDAGYRKTIEQFAQCKKYLEENHPHFKPLPTYNNLSELSSDHFNTVRSRLKDDELIYQLVLVDNLLVYHVISVEGNEINVELIDLVKYKELYEHFTLNINYSDSQLRERECTDAFIELCDSYSLLLIKPLYPYLESNQYKKLYFMPDLNLTYISMNYMRYDNQWLIEHLDSIENIIDYNVVGSTNTKEYGKQVIAHFLNKQDSSISSLFNMMKKQKQIEIHEAIGTVVEVNQGLNSFILVGHGISNLNGYNYIGAKEIKKSKKSNINLAKYLQVNGYIKNVMIISCSSGTLINDYAERNNGVWSSLFEKNISSILFCKWDVSIEFTNKLLERLLRLMNDNDQLSMSEALIQAQRQLSSYHPILWAGLEVWKNE